eukprot:Hpha_TRINITY_DN15583_c4_g4::TRINITY_DN15583_c4_g4_i1::g.104054::m.104054
MLSHRSMGSMPSARGRKVWVRSIGDTDDEAIGIRVPEGASIADVKSALVTVVSFSAYGISPDSITAASIELYSHGLQQLSDDQPLNLHSPETTFEARPSSSIIPPPPLQPSPGACLLALRDATPGDLINGPSSLNVCNGDSGGITTNGSIHNGSVAQEQSSQGPGLTNGRAPRPSTPSDTASVRRQRASATPAADSEAPGDTDPVPHASSKAVRDAADQVRGTADWKVQVQGLSLLRRLCMHHAQIVRPNVGGVTVAAVQGLRSQRQVVVRVALHVTAVLLPVASGAGRSAGALVEELLGEVCRLAEGTQRSHGSAAAALFSKLPLGLIVKAPGGRTVQQGVLSRMAAAEVAEIQAAPPGPLLRALHTALCSGAEQRGAATAAVVRAGEAVGSDKFAAAAASALPPAAASELCAVIGVSSPVAPTPSKTPGTPAVMRSSTAGQRPTPATLGRQSINLANSAIARPLLQQRGGRTGGLRNGSDHSGKWEVGSTSSLGRHSVGSRTSSLAQTRGSLKPRPAPVASPNSRSRRSGLATPRGSPTAESRPAPCWDQPDRTQLERELADKDDLILKLQAENEELRRKTVGEDGVVFLSIPLAAG